MNVQEIDRTYGLREVMEYDVVVVDAGPVGLSASIRLKQLALERGREISVCILEKDSESDARILSGAVMNPKAVNELFPDWKEQSAPLSQPVTRDDVLLLSERERRRTPDALVPHNFHNDGCYAVSLGAVTKWLAEQAEELGVEIFPGFAASEVLFNDDGSVKGVATGDMGLGKDGEPGDHFQCGIELHTEYTVFVEDARGHFGKQLIARFKLDEGKDPQSYAIGVKKLWGIPTDKAKPGLVAHTAGRSMNGDTYGGGFLYHLEGNKVTLGFVTGLDYKNPWFSPFEEVQRWRTHPTIRAHTGGGKRLGYGVRAITVGGLLSLSRTVFPGGALVGCGAGFLNATRIKGSHAAVRSGMLCAEAAFDALVADRSSDALDAYSRAFQQSWLHTELYQSRNFKQWFKKGNATGALMTGVKQWFLPKAGVKTSPWTIHHTHTDHVHLCPASECPKIEYPKSDGSLTFNRLSSVFVSNTNHEENQPAHLTFRDASMPMNVNLAKYGEPESRYCPAGMYEFVHSNGAAELVINTQNCVHCKTCDIKNPTQNIVWVTPEGGGGPSYVGV